MKVLESLPSSALSPQFVEAGDNFTEFIRRNARPKMVKGDELTGKSFGMLAEKYVEAIAKKHVCIETTYQVNCLSIEKLFV